MPPTWLLLTILVLQAVTNASGQGFSNNSQSQSPNGVRLNVQDRYVIMDNGILQLTLSNPDGMVTGVRYNGVDNVLEVANEEGDRGYWDLIWNSSTPSFDRTKGSDFKIIIQSEEKVEVSFRRTWTPSTGGSLVPLNIDKRFVMLHGSSGFYSYAIFEHIKEWPGFHVAEIRLAFKLLKDKFHYMAISNDRQRIMPMPEDREADRSQQLAYPEAVLLTNPMNPALEGEVDDKYQYSSNDEDIKVHGWISSNPPIGVWQITASGESRVGGPRKQDLTSHVGPTSLNVFLSAHYTGHIAEVSNGEYWKKVFGPVFVYLNSNSNGTDPKMLWEDAKMQMQKEVASWPYEFPVSEDFPKHSERGSVHGKLIVRDWYIKGGEASANGGYVGLALPGEVGSWQTECKGYQFWTRTDANGSFSIANVRTGVYNLFAWVPGFVGEYRYNATITITSGNNIDLGNLVYEPPRDGATLWEIGIPDRSAAEFYVPDPDPKYVNRLYVNLTADRFRQYGLWERYADLYPHNDLVYDVKTSDYKKDWFFAQVTRKTDQNLYQPTMWQIKFYLDSMNQSRSYKLRVALASASYAKLQVRFNDMRANPAHFTTGYIISRENAIARHGIHGLYWFYNITVQSSWLVQGENTIFLNQTQSKTAFQGIMYDYIRMEGS